MRQSPFHQLTSFFNRLPKFKLFLLLWGWRRRRVRGRLWLFLIIIPPDFLKINYDAGFSGKFVIVAGTGASGDSVGVDAGQRVDARRCTNGVQLDLIDLSRWLRRLPVRKRPFMAVGQSAKWTQDATERKKDSEGVEKAKLNIVCDLLPRLVQNKAGLLFLNAYQDPVNDSFI